jgi:hypothetical protein
MYVILQTVNSCYMERQPYGRQQVQLPMGSVWNCNSRTLFAAILDEVRFLLEH